MNTKNLERIYSVIFLLLSSEAALTLEEISKSISDYSNNKETRRKMWARDQKLINELGYEIISENEEYSIRSNKIFLGARFFTNNNISVLNDTGADNEYKEIVNIFLDLENENFDISFEYNNKSRVVTPKKLLVYTSNCYLIGEENDREKTFNVEKIKNLVKVSQTTNLNKSTNVNEDKIDSINLKIESSQPFIEDILNNMQAHYKIDADILTITNISKKSYFWFLSQIFENVSDIQVIDSSEKVNTNA